MADRRPSFYNIYIALDAEDNGREGEGEGGPVGRQDAPGTPDARDARDVPGVRDVGTQSQPEGGDEQFARSANYTSPQTGPDHKNFAVYNTANGAFAVVDAIDDLPEEFLVDLSPAGELSALKDKFNAYRNDTTTLGLCIAPTYACNARCPYCYEHEKHALAGNMSPQVQEQLVEFLQKRYDAAPFKSLDIQWYGGDPQLALDVVANLSARFMEFCAIKNIAYTALILTNATRINEEDARIIKDAGITQALVTIEGTHDVQNTRRPLVDGADSYECAKRGVAALAAAGVDVVVTANIDKVSILGFEDLREEFRRDLGLDVSPLKLNDYNGSFGCGKFAQPDFDLFTHGEYPFALYNLQKRLGLLDARAIRDSIAAVDHFCSGQKNTYLVIDPLGDCYDCDGYMGVPDHKLFSIFDPPEQQVWDAITNDPFDEPKCRACKILPICMGNCKWERNCCNDPCHPLKQTLPLYLKDLADNQK